MSILRASCLVSCITLFACDGGGGSGGGGGAGLFGGGPTLPVGGGSLGGGPLGGAFQGGAPAGGAGAGGGFAMGPCGDCLTESCGAAVQACASDEVCASVVDCTVTSGCINAESTQEQLADCVQACGETLGLTNQQKIQVANQLADLASCAPACAADCQMGGGAP